MKRWHIAFWAAALLLFTAQEARSQSYRNEIGVPPTDVYQSMMGFAERKDFGKVSASLGAIKPIVNHISSKYKENPADAIKSAVDQGNADKVMAGVRRLISLDIKDLLDQALQGAEDSPDASKIAVKAARLNYELLSTEGQKRNFGADQKIKRFFADVFRILGTESVYSGEKKQVDTALLKQQLNEIIANLDQVI
ncbi:MAG TPA: hypothetical protein VI702_05290 [Nitrospiria bacterium]